jgi:hypothetical protein
MAVFYQWCRLNRSFDALEDGQRSVQACQGAVSFSAESAHSAKVWVDEDAGSSVVKNLIFD